MFMICVYKSHIMFGVFFFEERTNMIYNYNCRIDVILVMLFGLSEALSVETNNTYK